MEEKIVHKAANIRDLRNAFKLEPIRIEEMEAYYVENYAVRSSFNVREEIEEILKYSQSQKEHILFTGYKGCGKSTELNHLQKDIEDNFLVINFSIEQELNALQLNYIEIFIVIMEQLFKKATDEDLLISKDYLESVQNWLALIKIEELNQSQSSDEVEAGGGIELSVPTVLSFFSKLRFSSKNSNAIKKSITKNIEPRLSELVKLCNDLINEVKLSLSEKEKSKKDLLIIVEDLDKLPPEHAEKIFLNYIAIFTLLETNIIYTFPFALYRNPKFNTISNYFHHILELPMIKVFNKEGAEYEPGIKIMQEMVEQRMVLSLFEHENDLKKIILKSGGVIRDLFRMIKNLPRTAKNKSQIEAKDVDFSINNLKNTYSNNIGDIKIGETQIAAEDLLKTLEKVEQTKIIENTDEQLLLLQNLSILGYNGENWYDVHPLLKEVLKERKQP